MCSGPGVRSALSNSLAPFGTDARDLEELFLSFDAPVGTIIKLLWRLISSSTSGWWEIKKEIQSPHAGPRLFDTRGPSIGLNRLITRSRARCHAPLTRPVSKKCRNLITCWTIVVSKYVSWPQIDGAVLGWWSTQVYPLRRIVLWCWPKNRTV